MRVLGVFLAIAWSLGVCAAKARAQANSAAETSAFLQTAFQHQEAEAARRQEIERQQRAERDFRFKATSMQRRAWLNPSQRARERAWALTGRRPPLLRVRPPTQAEGRPGPEPSRVRPVRPRTPQEFGRIPPARVKSVRAGTRNLPIRFLPPSTR